MNKTPAIITTVMAFAFQAQAVRIDITEQTSQKLVFNITETGQQGWDRVTQTANDPPFRNTADIWAHATGGNVVDITVDWQTYRHTLHDEFTQRPFRLIFPEFEGSNYRLLSPGVWQWTYVNPVTHNPGVIADNGSVLAMIGGALLGIWSARKILA
jgi:hypothetical protein